jgi:hypothetical protein
MKRPRKNSKLWQYLEASGTLDLGPDKILAAKEQFRKEYLKTYKDGYKTTHTHYNIALTPKEKTKLVSLAKEHRLKPSSFLKYAALSYCNQTFFRAPDSTLNILLQTLLRTETAIKTIAGKDKGSWYKPDRRYAELEETVHAMRDALEELYGNPVSLEMAIRQKLKQEPEYYKTIQTILSDDSKKYGT